jgi:molybdopterin/thiamine biosynthesis adenylyltransferase
MDDRFIRNPINSEEQEKLRAGKVFVAGCGGLGGYIIEYLARMGVGHIICADNGRFEPSNLNRQLLSEAAAIGREKVACARERVSRIGLETDIRAINIKMDETNLPELVRGCNLVMDALDNTETRKALLLAAKNENVPVIHAAVSGWWAQAAFIPPKGILKPYPDQHAPEKSPDVMSFTPGFAAAIQAALAARCLLGYPCDNDLHIWNLQTMEYKRLKT